MNDTKRLAKIVGYDGGDSEDVLLNALKQAVDIEIADNWDRIRKKDMYIGSIVGTIIARGYIKKSRLGFAGYMVTFVGKAETYCRQCLACWRKRRDFDTVRQWLANNTFKPAKASGPILFLDSHKAWLNPNARQKKQKKLSAKEWRQLAQFYRNSLDQVGDEHVKLAEDADREPRVWNQIVLERAKIEAEFSETAGDSEFPVTATRPEGVDDEQGAAQEAVGAVLLEEHADFDDAVQPQDSLPESKQYQGVDFTVVGKIHIPPRHPQRPLKPVLRLPHCVVREPDIAGDSIIIQSDTRPDPARIVLSPTAVAGDERDEIERLNGLPANWARKSALKDARCRNIRAFFYREWGARLTPAELKTALKLPRKVWSDAGTVADVLAQIDALMAA